MVHASQPSRYVFLYFARPLLANGLTTRKVEQSTVQLKHSVNHGRLSLQDEPPLISSHFFSVGQDFNINIQQYPAKSAVFISFR